MTQPAKQKRGAALLPREKRIALASLGGRSPCRPGKHRGRPFGTIKPDTKTPRRELDRQRARKLAKKLIKEGTL